MNSPFLCMAIIGNGNDMTTSPVSGSESRNSSSVTVRQYLRPSNVEGSEMCWPLQKTFRWSLMTSTRIWFAAKPMASSRNKPASMISQVLETAMLALPIATCFSLRFCRYFHWPWLPARTNWQICLGGTPIPRTLCVISLLRGHRIATLRVSCPEDALPGRQNITTNRRYLVAAPVVRPGSPWCGRSVLYIWSNSST